MRILSIDGGEIRRIIPGTILVAFEKQFQEFFQDDQRCALPMRSILLQPPELAGF